MSNPTGPLEAASILHPELIRAVLEGDAAPAEREMFLATVRDVLRWRAEETERLDLWGDTLESRATADALDAALRSGQRHLFAAGCSERVMANALMRTWPTPMEV